MTAVVDPAADVIWGSVGTIVSEQGIEERAPKTDEEWAAVLNSAFVITESGNLMMMGGRAKDTGEWMRQSQALIDVGARQRCDLHARRRHLRGLREVSPDLRGRSGGHPEVNFAANAAQP
jgi:hypothetical protein